MKRVQVLLVCLILLSLGSVWITEAAHAQQMIKRFALIVGSNDGGPERVTLRYAISDALKMQAVLVELGGFDRNDIVFLQNPSRTQLLSYLNDITSRMRQASQDARRIEFLFYYSGHSTEQGICLGRDIFEYTELKSLVPNLPADLTITILDSCSSGALVLGKGSTRIAPFLYDDSSEMEGQVVLASSSADEISQESDTIRASFFTHALVNGLRGAADTSNDNVITLNEAYAYAYEETLNQSSRTLAGSQHPVFDIRLMGTGELVLTDLRNASSRVSLHEELSGRVLIAKHDGETTLESNKEADKASVLALEPGTYTLQMKQQDGQTLFTEFELQDGENLEIDSSKLQPLENKQAIAKGNEQEEAEEKKWFEMPEFVNTWDHFPFELALVPPVSLIQVMGKQDTTVHMALGLMGVHVHSIQGAEIGSLFGIIDKTSYGSEINGIFTINKGGFSGAQISGIFNISGGPFLGFQTSGIFCVAGGSFLGIQASTINMIGSRYAPKNQDISVAKSTAFYGGQIGVINLATADRMVGAQIGTINHAIGELFGTQIGVVNSLEGNGDGHQLGVVNHVRGDFQGSQVGVVNSASGSFKGAQMGVLNRAGTMRGFQLGVVNVAEEMKGFPLGLINIMKSAHIKLNLFFFNSGEDFFPSIGLKWVNSYFYSRLGLGMNAAEDGFTTLASIGMGVHVPIKRFYIEAGPNLSYEVMRYNHGEESTRSMRLADSDDLLLRYQLVWGVNAKRRVSFFAGVGLDHTISTVGPIDKNEDSDYPVYYTTFQSFSPAFFGGIDILLSSQPD